MAFTQETFAPISASATTAPKLYAYSTSDAIATVQASGYFDDKKFQLEEGDVVYVVISNLIYRLTITAVSPSVTTDDTINGGNLNLTKELDGVFRILQTNTSDGASSAVGYSFVNDAGHYATIGLGGSLSSIFPSNAVFFSTGHNDTLHACAGNKSHKFYQDDQDRHSPLLSNQQLNMELKPDGGLSLPRGIVEHVGAWDDLRFPVNLGEWWQGSTRYDYSEFDGTIDFAINSRYPEEWVSFTAQMPHAWEIGTDIHPHLHWYQTLDESTNPVNWLLAYQISAKGATVSKNIDYSNHTFVTPSTLAVYNWTSGRIHQITEFPAIDMSAYGLSDIIHFVLWRDVANTSTEFSGPESAPAITDALEFDIHYKIDTAGSRQEYVK